jgi:ABC-2 type transport system permease protein
MGLIMLLVRKDLLRRLRSPLSILVILCFPLIFSALLAMAFGGGSGVPRAQILIEDLDDSFLSRLLLGSATSEQMGEYFDVRQVGAEGAEMMEAGEASALVQIPADFGTDVMAGELVVFELVRNPAQGILPEIAEQSLTVFTELLSAASRILREPLDGMQGMIDSDREPTAVEVASLATVMYETIDTSEGLLFPPAIKLETVQLKAADDEDDVDGSSSMVIFLFILPGISVWALFMVSDSAMRDILTEATEGTLNRQLSGPLSPAQFLLGKVFYTAVLSTISLIIISTIGWFASSDGVDAVGFLVLSATVILAATGYASIIYGGAKSEQQGATFSSLLLLVFGFTGGAFIPINSLPDVLQSVARISPFYWATVGYQSLLVEGGGLPEVLLNIGVLGTIGLVLLMTGTALLRRKIRSGATT